MSLAGIVLAAGLSERMEGGPKQLLSFGDRTMVGHVVATAEASSLDPIIVVTGNAAAEVERTMSLGRSRIVRNPHPEHGNMSSLHVGATEVGTKSGVMLLLADQPEMTVETIETTAAAFLEFRPFASVTLYGGVVGHPWILSPEAIEATAALHGAKALWGWLMDEHHADLLEIEVGGAKPIDVNTTADYQMALRRLGLWEQTQG